VSSSRQVSVRPARTEDAAEVAAIWHRGWRQAHLGNVPNELTRARTDRSFRTRAQERVADTTVADVDGGVAGFIMVVGDEVEQVYVGEAHRGTGVAAVLLAEAERQVRAGGHETAWLAVVAGNEPARRFYAKHGWVDEGLFDYQAAGPEAPITVRCHRYTKAL
jgi:GNAT superfamily N-acetyltransferase